MAEYVTYDDLVLVKTDINNIGSAANEDKMITPRLGNPYKSIPMLSRELGEKIQALTLPLGDGKKILQGINTLADLNTLTEKWDGRLVYVKDVGLFSYNLQNDTWQVAFNAADGVVTQTGQTQQKINDSVGAKWHTSQPGYELNSRVMLDTGEIVRSTIPNNKDNPNNDLTNWIKDQADEIVFGSQLGIKTDGVSDNRSILSRGALTSKNVVLGAGNYFISNDLTLNFKSLRLLDGAKLIIPENKTITINCPLYLGNSDHFNTEGRVKLTQKCKLPCLRIEWWGGANDNTTDCYPAIQKLFDSVYYGTRPMKLELYTGSYAFSNKFVTLPNFHITGQTPINYWYTNPDSTTYTVLRGYGEWVGYFIQQTDFAVVEKAFIIGSNTFSDYNNKLQGGLWITGANAIFRYVSGAYWGLEGLKVEGGIVYGDTGYWNNCCTAGKTLDGNPLSYYQGCVTLNGTDNCIRGVHGGSRSDELTATGWVTGILVGGGSSCRYSDLVGENADYGVVINGLYGMFINLRPERCSKNALVINGDYNSITNLKIGMQVGTSDLGNIDGVIVNGSSNKIANVISDIYNSFRHFIVDNRTSLGEGDASYGNYYSGLPSYQAGTLPANITGLLLKHLGSAMIECVDRNTAALINNSGVIEVQNYTFVRLASSTYNQLITVLGGVVAQRVLISTPVSLTVKNNSNGASNTIKTLTNADVTLPPDGYISLIRLPNGYWLQEL